MNSYFGSEFFAGNRERLKQLFTGKAPIVLTANGLFQKSADETYRFVQDSSFWYLTGIDEPNIILVIDKDKEYLIVPELSHAREMFDGAISSEKLMARSGISEILTEKEGWKRLGGRLKRVKSVAVLAPAPSFVESLGMHTNPARRRLVRELKKHNNDVHLLDIRQHLQRMRMVKQPAELLALQRAVDITQFALKKIEAKFYKGAYKNEFEIELDLTRFFKEKGAEGHGFDPIVAGGPRGAQVHYMENNAPLSSKEPILLDVGARYENYAADISRCWAIEPSKRFRAVCEAVEEVAAYSLALLKPGVVVQDYEKQVEHFMGEKLRALGLIKTIDSESIRQYFPHRTSHFLGIDVHDVGDYDLPLLPGVVLTVEPGIYIAKEGLGVRIEDDVLITEKGCKVLSSGLQ